MSAKSHGCFPVSVCQKFSIAFATVAYLLLPEMTCSLRCGIPSPSLSLLLSDISFLVTFGDADLLPPQVDMHRVKTLLNSFPFSTSS